MTDKEEIYDREIAPLVTEIYNICKKNDITMVTAFQPVPGILYNSLYLPKEIHPVFIINEILLRCVKYKGVDTDGFIAWLEKNYQSGVAIVSGVVINDVS